MTYYEINRLLYSKLACVQNGQGVFAKRTPLLFVTHEEIFMIFTSFLYIVKMVLFITHN